MCLLFEALIREFFCVGFTTFLQDISKYSSFSVLPRDISQQIFNELVESHCLSDSSLEAFRDCALEVILSYLVLLFPIT